MAQEIYWPLLQERIDAELAVAQVPQQEVYASGFLEGADTAELHPLDGPPRPQRAAHPANRQVAQSDRALLLPARPQPLTPWQRVLMALLGVLLLSVVVVTVDPIGQAILRGLAVLQAAAPLLLFGLFAIVAVTAGYLLQHPPQPPKRQHRHIERRPLDRAPSQPLLDTSIEHLQYISAWLRTDPGLAHMVDDVIGERVAAVERRQGGIAIVLALVSSLVSLVIGALLSTLVHVLHP